MTERYRLAGPVIFWWVWVAFVALNVIDDAVQGISDARFGAVISAILLLVTGLAYTLALRPKVIADDDGITVVNPYRTHVIPWRLITLVDTGEWVRVHYRRAPGADVARGFAATPEAAVTSADSEKVDCWALYVSARARRKIAAGPPRPRDPMSRGALARLGLGLGVARSGYGGDGVGATPSSRLPDEARYLASLPPAKAMAVRLDTRADRERTRPATPAPAPQPQSQPTATWSWPALAAVLLPALILLAVPLA